MRVHHISCGAFRPPLRRLTYGPGSVLARGDYVVHCLLIELPDRLVLVDTGLSKAGMEHPVRSLGLGMAWGGGAGRGTTALEHVARLGFTSSEVTDILMTHLDKDHAGGLADFPQARVHVHPRELEAARRRDTVVRKQRYSPLHFAHGPQWVALDVDRGEPWHGIPGAVVPDGLPDSLRMLPLPGHSAGHCGVALQLDDGRWLLHCGDAVYHPAWLKGGRPPSVVQMVESVLQEDAAARRVTREMLLDLMERGEATVLCSHDRDMFEALGGVE